MAKDVVVKVVANTSQFDNNMKKATSTLTQFGKGGVANITSMLGPWGKLAAAIGGGALAIEGFNKIMSSSQTLGDSWTRATAAMTESTDAFFYAIGSGDFTVMEQGLDRIIAKSNEYQNALDQLGNTQMSYSAIQAEENYNFQKAYTDLKSAKKGTEEYSKALKDMQTAIENMTNGANYAKNDLVTAMQTGLAKKTTLDASQISFEMIGNALKANATEWGREGGIERAKADYKAYRDQMQKISNMKAPANMYYTGANGEQSKIDALNAEKEAAQKKLNAQYKDQIVLFAALEVYGDDFLKGLTSQYNEYFNLQSAIEGYEQRLNKATAANEKLASAGDKAAKKSGEAIGYYTTTQGKNGLIAQSQRGTKSYFSGASSQGIAGMMQNASATVGKASQGMLLADSIREDDKAVNSLQSSWDHLQKSMQSDSIGTLAGAFGSLGAAIGGAEGQMISFVGTMAQQIAAGIMNIANLKAQEEEHKAKMTAAMGDAAAEAMAAHSSIPFVGVALGVAAVATIIATLMSLPKFAEGGIVGGNSYEGDKLLARVNSGEAILNTKQQARLNSILDNTSSTQRGGKVKFEIEGRKLVGILQGESARNQFKA